MYSIIAKDMAKLHTVLYKKETKFQDLQTDRNYETVTIKVNISMD